MRQTNAIKGFLAAACLLLGTSATAGDLLKQSGTPGLTAGATGNGEVFNQNTCVKYAFDNVNKGSNEYRAYTLSCPTGYYAATATNAAGKNEVVELTCCKAGD